MTTIYRHSLDDLTAEEMRRIRLVVTRYVRNDVEDLVQETACVMTEAMRRGRLPVFAPIRWYVSMAGYRLGRRDFTRTMRTKDGVVMKHTRADAMSRCYSVEMSEWMHPSTSFDGEGMVDARRFARHLSERTLRVVAGSETLNEIGEDVGVSHQAVRQLAQADLRRCRKLFAVQA